MTPRTTIFRLALCLGLWAVCVLAGPISVRGEENPEVKIGFESLAKLGHWLPVTFEFPAATTATSWRITTLDGEDTPVATTGPLWRVSDNADTYQALVQFGRTYGQLKIELLDASGEVCFEESVALSNKPAPRLELLPSTTPLIVCVEPKTEYSVSSQIKSVFPSTGSNERTRVAIVHDAGGLPVTREAWSACESVVLVVDDESFVSELPGSVARSLSGWVRQGGHLFLVSSPRAAMRLEQTEHLKDFLPGKVVAGAQVESTRRRIEDFAGSDKQLLQRGEQLPVIGMEDPVGNVVLEQGGVPLVLRSPLGLGEVTFVTIDVKGEKFRQWEGSARFLQSAYLLRSGNRERGQTETRTGTAVVHSGYKDLQGQLKVPLDSYSKVGFIPFALIATLVALYILCIGPGDWFLVGRLLKKHELTWITFPLMTLLFCGLAWYIASLNRPTDIQVNQFETIDIDSVSGEVRGTVWANLYNPNTRTVDLGIGQKDLVDDIEDVRSRVSWLGLPGSGLGGMQNRANPGLFRTGYQQVWSADADQLSTRGLELQVSSTRPVLMQWTGNYGSQANSRLLVDERLEGIFANPFDRPLKNCMLFFGGYVYLVRGTLDAGETVDIFSETTEKDTKSYLTRQRFSEATAAEIKSQSVPWDPASDDMERIAMMMMFHQSAGGKFYTNMTNQFHEFVDMTPNSQLDRAVLVGTLQDRVTEIEIDGQSATDLYDRSLTIVRVVLPVERKSKR